MAEIKLKRALWYTLRDGIERGPYPEKQISRYLLLGRIRDSDQLRQEQGDWKPLSGYPELIPEVMKLPPTEENLQKLLMARMREDERRPIDRRDRGPAASKDVLERRAGVERRQNEADAALRYRTLKYELSHATAGSTRLYRYPLIFTAIVVLVFLTGYVLQQLEADNVPPDCAAGPRPGVNWSNCNLSGLRADRSELTGARMKNARMDAVRLAGAQLVGANLEYASFNGSDLKRADLSYARLTGVTLRGSDLRYANLREADLSYANLSGANIEGTDFTGTILDRAIWVDQRPCAPDSIGVCRHASISR
ncbi:MAG: pentapeptide repeat-containing protein [Thiogranum sp.]|nr:pentapeptide repeat-containing protein [Thiogranum sp.]